MMHATQVSVLASPWIKLFTIAGLAAVSVTKTTDFVRNLIDKQGALAKWVWNVVPTAIAFGEAFLFHLNLAPQAGLHVAVWAGELVTAVGIAGAAGGYHELFDLLSSHAKKARATAGAPTGGDVLR